MGLYTLGRQRVKRVWTFDNHYVEILPHPSPGYQKVCNVIFPKIDVFFHPTPYSRFDLWLFKGRPGSDVLKTRQKTLSRKGRSYTTCLYSVIESVHRSNSVSSWSGPESLVVLGNFWLVTYISTILWCWPVEEINLWVRSGKKQLDPKHLIY